MKRKLLFVAILALTSCVSKSDYEYAEDQATYWENAYEEKCNDYENLRIKYNQLVDEYNELYSELNEKENIINNAQNSVRRLKSDFSSYRSGWSFYDANDIEDGIRRVENNLNGWW